MSWIHHPVAGLFLVAGCLSMLCAAAWIAVETREFLDAAERVPGIVVELRRERGVRGSTRDHPVVEYRDPASGAIRRFQSRFGIWPSPFAVGDGVEVAIVRDPPRVEIDSFWTMWFLPLLLAGFGVACGVAGRSILLRPRRAEQGVDRPDRG
jgi:hypothetical protein